jgi:hypothetical protein
MRRIFLFAGLAGLAGLAALAPACSSDDIEVSELTVLPYLAPCRTNEVLDCMLVDEGSGAQLFYDNIEGFTYHWGSTYRLEVEIRKIAHPVPDQSSREVRLREVLEVTPVAPRSEFTITLRGDPVPGAQPLTPAGQGFAMSFGRQIVCEEPAVCTAIADALRQSAAFDLTLRHPNAPTDEQLPLTALAVASH